MIKISKKLITLATASVALTGLSLDAQTSSSRAAMGNDLSNFYTDNIPNRTMNVVTDFNVNNNDTNSDISDVQDAINTLADQGGGTLVFPSGDYRIQAIRMRSNIRLEFRAGARITARFTGGRNSVFEFGGRDPISNVEITGASNRQRLRINLLAPDRRRNVQFFNFVNITNAKIANITMNDNESIISAISSAPGTTRILVQNVEHTGAARGYGLMQVKTGRRMMFMNVGGDGGTTFRVETGNSGSNSSRNIGEVFGRDVRNTNANTVIFSRPDGRQNGFFDVRGATARSCGFISRHNGDATSFETSYLRQLRGFTGSGATIRTRDRSLIPCENRNLPGDRALRDTTGAGGGEFLTGPPVSGIIRRGGGAPYLRVSASDITLTGFFLTPGPFVDDPEDDFGNCSSEPRRRRNRGERRRNRRNNNN